MVSQVQLKAPWDPSIQTKNIIWPRPKALYNNIRRTGSQLRLKTTGPKKNNSYAL
jgi:hypothetical protein